MAARKLHRSRWCLFIAGAICFMTLCWSLLPFGRQEMADSLPMWFRGEALKELLRGIVFHYAGEEVSIANLGYTHFVLFFIRKITHFLVFFAFGLTLAIGLNGSIRERWLAITVTIGLIIGFAALDEGIQLLTVKRTGLVQDFILDIVGGILAVLLYHIVFYRKQRRRRKTRPV